MKLILRNSKSNDLDKIYQLQYDCFNQSDRWYKSIIPQYLNNSLVIETIDNEIIGVLLQGNILPCENNDLFIPIDDYGNNFKDKNNHKNDIFGIVMICINPDFRKKGLAQKLINKHLELNNNKLLCLNTRFDNQNAISLYKKMGYIEIGYIKEKYFFPNEDAIFMINLNNIK